MLHNPDKARYDRVSIAFHWLTAALVLLLWLMAQSEAVLPREWRHGRWSFHITTGAVLIFIYGARLLWLMSAATRPTSVNIGMLRMAEQVAHGLLYALLAAALVLGVVNVAVRGWDLFGIVQVPGFASDDRALRRSINGWHELAANALLCLAVIHAVAALYHQLVRGDGLLKRMWFARRNIS